LHPKWTWFCDYWPLEDAHNALCICRRWSVVKAVGSAFFATFIPFFDIPVFWPILVIYFFALCFMTMRRQLAHMWKHKYIPFDMGKKSYTVTAPFSVSEY
jgi:hypothetical protein